MSQRWAVALLAVMTVGLMGAHAGGLLRFAYPLVAVALGVYLEGTSPSRYVVLVVWLWVLSPLVRRLGDYQAGFQDPSLIILTPYLVTAIGIGQHLIRCHILHTRPMPKMPPGAVVFVFVIAGAAFGLPIGLIKSPSSAMLETLNWMLPPMFGWYLATISRRELLEIEGAFVTTLHEVALVAGAYGVWQFLSPPPWDAAWMLNSGMTTIGRPEPFQVRVFSTMHAPAVVATVLAVPVTLWLAKPTLGRLPATCAAAATLILSQVRTNWLGFVVSAVLVMVCLPGRLRIRLAVLLPLACLVLAPMLMSPDVSDVTSQRFATLAQPSTDTSAMARLQGHVLSLYFVTGNPLGGGIGLSEPGIESYIGMRDSVILPAILQFGVIGGLIYALGFGCLAVLLWGYYRSAKSADRIGLAAAGLGLLPTAALAAVTAGPSGMILWTIVGFAAGTRVRSVRTEALTARSAECTA